MKSFFKKLAFVMALAMVVSVAAPAGYAAEAAEFFISRQGEVTAITEVKVDVTKSVDLSFQNAPANWEKNFKWRSDDDAVAVVDQSGLVTGRANGTATITVTSYDEVATVKVVVGTGVKDVVVEEETTTPEEKPVATGYVVEQTTATKAEIIFNGTHSYTEKDVVLYYVLEGGYEVKWPLEAVKVTDNGFEIKPYVDFEDQGNYIVKFAGEEAGYPFTTEVGKPTDIEVSYKSNKEEWKAYVDQNGTEIPVEFVVKFWSDDVDVTEVYEDAEVYYELVYCNDYDNVYLDEYEGLLYFYDENVIAEVKATYTWYDENDEAHNVDTLVQGIRSEFLPTYKVTGVTDWTIVKKGTAAKDIKWGVDEIKANDDALAGYDLVVKLEDNRGNVYVNNQALADAKLDDNVFWTEDTTTEFYSEGYNLQFRSADVSQMLVGTDGSLTTYVATEVPAIVSLYNNTDGDNKLVRNLRALEVVVRPERYIKTIKLDVTGAANITTDWVEIDFVYDEEGNATANYADSDYITKKVEVKILDQYNEVWTKEDKNVTITANVEGVNIADVKVTKSDKGTLTLNGANLKKALVDRQNVTLTLKVDNATTALRVNLKDPRYITVTPTPVTGTPEQEIKVTSWALKADDLDLEADKDADANRIVKISLTQLSNGLAVGAEKGIELYTGTIKNDYVMKDGSTVTIGDRFLAVYDPDNKYVGKFGVTGDDAYNEYGLGVKDNNDGTFSVYVGMPVNGVMKYLATNTYSAKILEVAGFNDKNEARMKVTRYTDTFRVSNGSEVLGFGSQIDDNTTEYTVHKAVHEVLTFTLDGKAWSDFKEADIVEVKGRYNEKAGYIIVTSVSIKVPLDGKSSTNGYVETVTVNKAIQVPVGFDASQFAK